MTPTSPNPGYTKAPERVAILGGGMAAMVAAFELTRLPDWRARFELTVYQQGHRLGGKSASGVNAAACNRIEEHGLHLLGGSYANVMRVMGEAYEELGRPPDAPLARWADAITGVDVITIPERREGGWSAWSMVCPRGQEAPDDALFADPRRLGARLLSWAAALFGEWARGGVDVPQNAAWEALAAQAREDRADAGPTRPLRLLARARQLSRAAPDGDPETRRRRVVLDLAWTLLRGVARDRLAWPRPNWFAVDHLDARAWLALHGASRETLGSPLVAALYQAVFAGQSGVGAGTFAHALLRAALTYQGSILYRMNAGAGDVLFAPLYQVLKRRGVRFAFFHTVRGIEPAADGRSVARVRLDRQATPTGGDYEALIDVNGLPCWPARPRLDQLADGDRLAGVDLEGWSDRAPAEPVVLERGRDFDRVILGLSVGVHPHVAAELMAASPRYDAMVRGLASTATRSAQLWTLASREELGWSGPAPLLSPFAAPFETWADMSHLLAREGHGPEVRGRHHLSGALPDDAAGADSSDPAGPDPVAAELAGWLRDHAPQLWPGVARGGALPPGLVASAHITPRRHPSDRYVLAAPGTNALRLRADASGFDNLLLAGDWTLNALSLGCLESAAMSGTQAAQALDASVRPAIGDWLPEAPPRAHAPARTLPRRIRLDGDYISTPPVALEIRLSMFVLPASIERLQALCDRALAVSPAHRYRAAAPWVVLYCAEVDNYPVVESLGWVPELDFGFWVPAWAGRAGDPFVAERLVTFTPYIWVDNGTALIGGREVFGFAKQLGRMRMPAAGGPLEWALSGQVVERFDRSSRAEERPILAVRQIDGSPTGPLVAVKDALMGGLGLPAPEVLARMTMGGLRMVFVKQTPDALDASRACYQALLEAECRFTGQVTGGLLPGRFAVTLHAYDSLRIASTLGLVARSTDGPISVIDPLVQGRASFSARIDAAEILWESRP